MNRTLPHRATVALIAALSLPAPALAEQWAYAMQTGHGNHSIQVDVDSIEQRPGYVAARLLYEYFYGRGESSGPAAGTAPRSALVEGAFDCQAHRFQALSRVEFSAPEAQGTPSGSTHPGFDATRWKPAGTDPETYAIIDWVCGVAAHRQAGAQAGSMP